MSIFSVARNVEVDGKCEVLFALETRNVVVVNNRKYTEHVEVMKVAQDNGSQDRGKWYFQKILILKLNLLY